MTDAGQGSERAVEQGDEADEAFGGMVAGMDMPPHARAGWVGRGHRFAAYPRCWADLKDDRVGRMTRSGAGMQDSQFRQFCEDEGPAVDELLAVVGGEARKLLDLSPESLGLLDTWVRNITSNSDWLKDEIWSFLGIQSRLPFWLELRCAYYLARVLRKRYGGDWVMHGDPEDEALVRPFFVIGDTCADALGVAQEVVAGARPEGLTGFAGELVEHLLKQGVLGDVH
jgi:hypothetical protein